MTNSPVTGMKTRKQPAMTPGSESGKVICQKAADRRAAEVGGGLEQRMVEPLERRVERQHHERQVRIDDADIDRPVGVEDGERLVDHAEPEQELVEQALLLEDADPGIDADQERGPERQDDQHHQRRLPRLRRPRHAVGDRVADERATSTVETSAIHRLDR